MKGERLIRFVYRLSCIAAVAGAVALIGLPSTQAQVIHPPEGCPLSFTVRDGGDPQGFVVSNYDANTISIQIAQVDGNPEAWGLWGTVVASNAVNTNVNVGPVNVGTKDPVLVTASKIDPNSSEGSFTLTATTTFGHYIVMDVRVNCPVSTQGCTLTQGFYKNKPTQWPADAISGGLNLGTVNYSQTQLLSILNAPVKGNGLIALAHQLIAAKLNVMGGATTSGTVLQAIADADQLIGNKVVPPVGSGSLSTSATSTLTSALDTYNNGLAPGSAPHCN